MNTQIPKINYQKKLDDILEKISERGHRPSLLLHSCCGPCSSYVVTYLRDYFNVTVFYYNPNIFPEEEYAHRLAEQARLLKELGIDLLEGKYDHQEFLDRVHGLESEPEGGKRCEQCFHMRLLETARIADDMGFDYFCTTLTVSPHKNAMIINHTGEELSCKAVWLPSDFKKKDGYKKSVQISEEYGLYRQNYCGCEFK